MHATLLATEACAWPVLTRLAAGTLGIVYFNQPDHGRSEGDLVALVSRDDGASWTPAGTPGPHDPGGNRMHLAAGVDGAGRWLVFSTGMRVAGGQYLGLEPLWLAVCPSPGASWSIDRAPRVALPETPAIPHGRIRRLPDGRLAATFYLSHGRGQPSRAWLALSSDGGGSWRTAGEIGAGDANEVVSLFRGDAPWLAVARTHVDHHLTLHRSVDGGDTWQFHRDLTLPLQHPGDLTDLGDGRLLLTYGLRNRGLMGIGARLSRDGGETWSAPVVLYQFGAATDCGYPSTVQCADATLLTACYSNLSPLHRGYHLLTLRWSPDDFFSPRPLGSVSDGRTPEA